MSIVVNRGVEDVLEWVGGDRCTSQWRPDSEHIEFALVNGLIVPGPRQGQEFVLTEDGLFERQMFL